MRKDRRKLKLNKRKTLQSTKNKINLFLILIKIMLRSRRIKRKTKRISPAWRKKLHQKKLLSLNYLSNCNHFRSNWPLKQSLSKLFKLVSRRLLQVLKAHWTNLSKLIRPKWRKISKRLIIWLYLWNQPILKSPQMPNPFQIMVKILQVKENKLQ